MCLLSSREYFSLYLFNASVSAVAPAVGPLQTTLWRQARKTGRNLLLIAVKQSWLNVPEDANWPDLTLIIINVSQQTAAKLNLPEFIRRQLHQDPQLPRTDPTVSAWQVPAHPEIESIHSAKLPTEVDLVVIGSDIAGHGFAKELLTNSATGRNGGRLTRIPPTRHTSIMQEAGAKKFVQLTRQGLEEMRKLIVEQGTNLFEASRLTEVEKLFGYDDHAPWDETVETVELFEKELPEDHGAYQLVSKEECASKYSLKDICGRMRFPTAVCSPYNMVSATPRYVMLCFYVAGIYSGIPLILGWTAEEMASPNQKRSVALAFVSSFGTLAIIWGSRKP
ncbi:hypothetical protein P154DRAFT_620745 [Amniculicola lignicola CBS 123094]|uniref:Uncharacterized protein n=1 Tax=Amniculicola lignicola CBS 123094 TaxID=1392246 RepID=A0A6A5WQF0_9PLEO|nr:hypothetical protein P154DRAFT_620745 [Amniculicola lignicola CBS 123094]